MTASDPQLYIGSIFDVKADAIVNPANGHLRHGGGLARIIAEAAQGAYMPGMDPQRREASIKGRGGYAACKEAWERDHRVAPLIATGNAHVTSAGLLPYKGVIHAVGPIWNGGHFYETELLAMALGSAMEAATERGWGHIAVPAISCGIFGFPVQAAARVLMDEASYGPADVSVTFAVMPEHEDAFRQQMTDPLFG